jgi:hypothetical protein
MIAKVTKRTELGALRALTTAHHAAIRSSSHSSMKTENWFQLRIVGVTVIREPSFGRAFRYRRAQPGRAISFPLSAVSQSRTRLMSMFTDAAGVGWLDPRARKLQRLCGRRGSEEAQASCEEGVCFLRGSTSVGRPHQQSTEQKHLGHAEDSE